jgi:hypothetical protein
LLYAQLKLVGSRSAAQPESQMRSILLTNGWWLIGDEVRRAVAKHLEGSYVIGHIVQGSDAKWKIEGRNHDFDSAALAADTLVEDLTKPPV